MAHSKLGYVYILASRRYGTRYVGVTSNLAQRVAQHRLSLRAGFTAKYGVKRLVYFEVHGSMYDAIEQEKRLKKWRRLWKIQLIEKANPEWRDLWPEIEGMGRGPDEGLGGFPLARE